MLTLVAFRVHTKYDCACRLALIRPIVITMLVGLWFSRVCRVNYTSIHSRKKCESGAMMALASLKMVASSIILTCANSVMHARLGVLDYS